MQKEDLLTRDDLIQFKKEILNWMEQIHEHLTKPPSQKKWLTEGECKQLLGVGRTTLSKYRKEGLLPFIQIQKKILYSYEDIEKLLLDHYSK